MIEFCGVSKSYGVPGERNAVPAIASLDLRVERGEFLVLIGASGSGKSTMLRMINRMESHDSGRILFDGREIYSFAVRELRLRIGYAIQSVGLFPHWSVARNIAAVPQLLGWSRQRMAARVDELLDLFGLEPALYRDRYPHQLSGGQQQRVGVARALAGDPAVLLMDEPFGALDPVLRASLQLEIKRVHRQSGKTIVMVTHDIDEALLLATRIVLLDRGRVVQVASPQQLLESPANELVRGFLGGPDIGLKLLSLRPASSLARAQPALPGPRLPEGTSLREAVSWLSLQRLAAVNLSDDAGRHAGVLHAGDIFNGPGA